MLYTIVVGLVLCAFDSIITVLLIIYHKLEQLSKSRVL